MDLGIKGRVAVVCASSKGLGRGCAEALAEAGVDLVINARTQSTLDATAAAIRAAHGVKVTPIACDITTREGQAAVLAAAGGAPDILVNNAGGPPPGLWSDWEREDWLAAIEANMLTPIMLMKAALPGMIDRGWGRVVNITSVSVKAPIAVLGLSNGARAGLTGYVGGTSRQVAPHGVLINNLLPGLHDTDRPRGMDEADARREGVPLEEIRARRTAVIPAGRYGSPEDFGAMCAFLCSERARFIVGQNILLDGGATNLSM